MAYNNICFRCLSKKGNENVHYSIPIEFITGKFRNDIELLHHFQVPPRDVFVLNKEILDQTQLVENKEREKSDASYEKAVLECLKREFNNAIGQPWKPGCLSYLGTSIQKTDAKKSEVNAAELSSKIEAQDRKIRDLKAQNTSKTIVSKEVKALTILKREYKEATGREWGESGSETTLVETGSVDTDVTVKVLSEEEILNRIAEQGEKIRKLKAGKAEKSVVDPEVKVLLDLKSDYKNLTGKKFKS